MNVEVLKQFTKELAKKITFNTENLYQHNIMIRFNDGNRKACASFINNDNTDYTRSLSKFIEYMKNTYSAENSHATGNLKNLLMCDGYYRNASGVWYYLKALFYSTDDNALRVLALQANTTTYAPNPNGLVVLSEYGTTFTVNDYVTTVALNNVNKPVMTEYTTNVTYNGSNIGTCKWTLLKYPVNATKFKYEWIGHCNTSVSIPVTNTNGSVYISSAPINITQPSMMTATQKNGLSCNMYAQNGAFFLYQDGSALQQYIMRPTSSTISGAFNINVYGSTVE